VSGGAIAGMPGGVRPAIGAAYLAHADLSVAVQDLAREHAGIVSVESIGTSREGRAIWAIRLAAAGPVEPDRRPAILVAANIDGDFVAGSAAALELARKLAAMAAAGDERAAGFLGRATLYVVPRVNPDAAERFFSPLQEGRRRAVRPDDRDRDGAVDEDPPNDLNGDGLITMMRVYDPEKADMMADPGEPRLDVKPDRDKGQRAAFAILTEGIDDDGDGAYNEDDLGGVDLNMNYMHGYKEHADGAGPHQVSEPESLALLTYVLAHQNIAAVLVYGRHDNLSSSPEAKGALPSGAPETIDPGDAGLYRNVGEKFREITKLQKVPSEPAEGAFFAWAYAQFGVPAVTTPLWTRPEPAKEEKKGDGKTEDAKPPAPAAGGGGEGAAGGAAPAETPGAGLKPSGIGDISQETIDELRAAAEARGIPVRDDMMAGLTPEMVDGFARRMGIAVRRVGGGTKGEASSKEEAAWLAYSDGERQGAGFVAWTPFEHPQLGRVEIGGWRPYFRANPPPEAVDAIASAQVEFVLDLAGRLPKVSLAEPTVTRLASGLYEVKTALVNDGYLPTGTAMAVRNRRARPYVVRLSLPPQQVLSGQRVNRAWSVPGSGGRQPFRWIVQAPDGSELTITVYSEKYGTFERTIWLRAAEPGGAP
jgi:hypothetical protein